METTLDMDREHSFWAWFAENEARFLRYEHTDPDAEQTLDLIHEALGRVDENLAFEFGPPASRREFIISAGGIEAGFPAVLRLQQSQPILERWDITYFRPRRDPLSTIQMDELEINSANIEFTILSRNTDVGLEVFIPGYDEADPRYKQIGYLFLDQALGEFDVETKLTYIGFFSTADPVKFDRIPFGDLPSHFDDVYHRLNGLSGQPS